MPRPFFTAPSPEAVRDEVKRVAESQATWSDDTVALIRNLEEFSESSAKPDPRERRLPGPGSSTRLHWNTVHPTGRT